MSYLGSTLLRLAVAAPITRFLIKQDQRRSASSTSFIKRIFLHLAILVVIVTFSYPFVSKEPNFFDHFNAVVTADKSTVYQQFRRAQSWIDEQVQEGNIDPEEAASLKTENDRMHSFIHDSGRKLTYMKFGDIVDYNNFEEPSFLTVTAFAANYSLWIISAVMLLCYYLPAGGILTIFLLLCIFFSVEIESRFIDSEYLFEYAFFVHKNEWTLFELIKAIKQSIVGVICLVIVLAGLFSQNTGTKTKSLARNLLKSNAGIVTLLKDENIKEALIEPDEPMGTNGANIANVIAKGLGFVVLAASIFYKLE